MDTIIGESSRSLVYLLNDQPENKPVVCKICSHLKGSKTELLNEYEITRLLNFDSIRKPINKGIFQNKEAIFYEYFNGITIKEAALKTKISLSDFLNFSIKIVQTLNHIHADGVIHHRINSHNILLNKTEGSIQIIDFSLATKKSNSKAPIFVEWGTELSYMAPEQSGHLNKTTDNRTDLYSLGVVLYELWTGKTPFLYHTIAEMIHDHIVKVPPPVTEARNDTPIVLAQIIEKLLNKSPDARYQTALGLEYDLLQCQQLLNKNNNIEIFKLGQKDYPDQIHLSSNFYGRVEEFNTLKDRFKNIKNNGNELIIISGSAGVGKSSLVHQFNIFVEENDGVFISGKFGQQNLQLPNRAMVQAFNGLAAYILSLPDNKLEEWKSLIKSAVDDIGQLLIEIVPEFKWIIGPQKSIPSLSVNQLESRVNFLFLRLIQTISTPEHPLVLFIDEIQNADPSSWRSFHALLSGNEINNFMFIGSFRSTDTEATQFHNQNLTHLLKEKPKNLVITLKNLEKTDILALINNSFLTDNPEELSTIVYNKTMGNPFFIRKFIDTIEQKKILRFVSETQKWVWDAHSFGDIQIADNVISYMSEKVKKLPPNVLKTLMVASCLGNPTKTKMLFALVNMPKEQIERDLDYYVSENLLEKETYDEYRFVHDRIQQTSNELISEGEKSLIHYKIAGLLLGEQNYVEDAKQMFLIASNYNLGAQNIKPDERIAVAEINYKVGIEAKKMASFELAFSYLKSALLLMNMADWDENYNLMMNLHNDAAECGMIVGESGVANELLETSLKRAKNFEDKNKAHEIRLVHLSETHQFPETVALLLEILDEIGYGIKRNPSKLAILTEFAKVKLFLLGKNIDDIPNLPEMHHEKAKAFIRLTTVATVSIFGTAPDILPIIYFRQVYLSLRYGNSEFSAFSYCGFGFAITVAMGDVINGYDFAKMSLKLLEKNNSPMIKAKVMVAYYGFLAYWKDSLFEVITPLREAYYIGRQTGDLLYASFAASFYNHMRMFTGDKLGEVFESMTEDCVTIKSLKQDLVYLISESQRQYVIGLLQKTEEPWVLKSEDFDEEACMMQLNKLGDIASTFNLYFYKLGLAAYFNEYELGHDYDAKAQKYEDETTLRQIFYPTYLLLSALNSLKIDRKIEEDEGNKIKKEVTKKLNLLKSFSKYAPQNYENKVCILEALILEKNGKIVEAAQKFQKGIDFSNEAGFVNEEALAREHFAYFLFKTSQKEFAELMLQKAFECYRKWGAENKCIQLSNNFPLIIGSFSNSESNNTIAGFQNIYDLNTIIKSNQVLSSENSLDGLLHKMVELVISNASSSKVVIIMKSKSNELLPYAIGTNESINILSEDRLNINQNQYPHSIIQYVMRSKDEFVSPNLAFDRRYNFDNYIKTNLPVSVCCIPIVAKGDFLGAIYFENDLTEYAYDQKRVEFFKTIAGQLAISLENVILYNEMDQKVKDRTWELGEKNSELTKEKKKSDDLLLNILPEETAEELKNYGKTVARRYDKATILFSDIKNFTKISEILSPEELVSELDVCFKKFDELTIQNGLEKIKTIGDAYMAVGGCPGNNKATVYDVVNTAIQMQEFMKLRCDERKKEGKPYFEMRLGINTGPVVSGVVGTKKFQFDIWGDAVNVAARMEQHSEVGRVNLSEATYNLVKDQYKCFNRGKVLAKSLGETTMYFVEEKI
ncbi:MAG: adenylate/guanylate cyclase domain-containing protein [Bacteroidota bacterium]